jgi:hypothetical protein
MATETRRHDSVAGIRSDAIDERIGGERQKAIEN